jgi:hypothetical protein
MQNLAVYPTSNLSFTGMVKWSLLDTVPQDYRAMTNNLPVSTSGGAQLIDLSKFKNFPALDTTKIYILQEAVVNSANTAEDVQITNSEKLSYNYILQGDTTITSETLFVTAVGPKISVEKQIYKVNGHLLTDTLMFDPDQILTLTVRLDITNTGNDPASETKIRIFPGSFYELADDDLPVGFIRTGDEVMLPIGPVLPGETRTINITYKLRAELKDLTDLMKVINSTAITYNGTAIEASFSVIDNNILKLGLNDVTISALSCSEPDGSNTVNIKATIFNRGLKAKNIIVRVYPVVGDGIPELPCDEFVVDSIDAYSSREFETNYMLPNNEKVSFVTVVDDENTFREIVEVNNLLSVEVGQSIVGVELPTALNTTRFVVFPNPVSDQLNVSIYMPSGNKLDKVSIITIDGKLVKILSISSIKTGENSFVYNSSQLQNGLYILEMVYSTSDGTVQRKTVPFIKK